MRKRMKRLICFLIGIGLSAQACAYNSPTFGESLPTPDESIHARETLVLFFDHLSTGEFQEASELYGGSYDVLIDNNPALDPNDHAALLRNACLVNGFQCLEVRSALPQKQASAREFKFLVEFNNPDGSLFARGQRCGAGETGMPDQSQFGFTVQRYSGGVYLVTDLPVYVP